MKYILIILCTFISFGAYSQSQVDSTGQLAPLGNYPVTSAKYIKGAQRTAATIADRDNIPLYLRDTGMLVYVTTIDSTYMLKGGINNTNWTAFKTGSGGNGNSRTLLDSVQTSGQALTIALYSGGGRAISVSTIGKNGSGFLSTYVTAGDSTYIDYDFAPLGLVIYKVTVLDVSDQVTGGGNEVTGGTGGGTSGGGTDTLIIIHKDTTVVYTDTTTNSPGPIDYNSLLNKPSLAPVATAGTYTSLTGKPSFATVATSGLYSDISGRPAFATVATTGDYNSLINRPSLATVATSGDYNSLLNKPSLAPVATAGTYTSLTGKPAFSTVATSGLYADLLSKPTFATVATSGLYSDLSGRPTLSTVAGTGNYSDLIGKPAIPAQVNLSYTRGVIITGTYPNLTAMLDTIYLNTYLASHTVLTSSGGGSCFAINTRFGLLSIPGGGETLQQYQLTQRTADSLGIDIIRQAISPAAGYAAIQALVASNRQTALNISNTVENGTRNFTASTERAAYVTYLDTLFRNTLAPAAKDTLIICTNEDANKAFHTLDTSTNLANQSAYRYWFNELKPMDSVANLYGNHFKITTGGVQNEIGWYFVWKNLSDSGRTAEAAEVARIAFPSGTNLTTYPSNASYAISIKYMQQLIPYIKASGIDYFNWHIKAITNGTDSAHIDANVITLGVQAWQNLTGKNVISTQVETASLNPNNTAELAAQCSKLMDYVIFYDGTSRTSAATFAATSVSYRNTDNSINSIGVNLRNVLQAIKR